jgi:demethylmenaquinone methyltransferase/2-methoxy-6-polyprenyl-1,4-benzoquinol methylase
VDEYTGIAPYYEFLLGKNLLPIRQNIRTFINFQEHKKIIDICCGTGRQLEMLHRPGRELYGVDVSPAMLNQTDTSYNIKYIQQSAAELQLPHETFDAVILTLALHEKNELDRELILRKSWKLLRPGGHLLLCDYAAVPDSFAGFFYGRTVIPVIERIAGKEHFQNYRSWMKNGALQEHVAFLHRKVDCISEHFGGALVLCAVTKEPEAKIVFQQMLSLQTPVSLQQ